MSPERPTVLIVEDEPPLVEIYSQWLSTDFDIRSATSGAAAIERFDEAVDVVLLDRLMPGMTGDQVLEKLSQQVDGTAVAMVTAVEPDFDLIGIGVDAYLTKPVTREELLTTVERLLDRRSLARREREYYQLVAKAAALRTSKDATELAASEEFAELEARIEAVRDDLTDSGVVDDAEFVARVRDLETEEESGDGDGNGNTGSETSGEGTDDV